MLCKVLKSRFDLRHYEVTFKFRCQCFKYVFVCSLFMRLNRYFAVTRKNYNVKHNMIKKYYVNNDCKYLKITDKKI